MQVCKPKSGYETRSLDEQNTTTSSFWQTSLLSRLLHVGPQPPKQNCYGLFEQTCFRPDAICATKCIWPETNLLKWSITVCAAEATSSKQFRELKVLTPTTEITLTGPRLSLNYQLIPEVPHHLHQLSDATGQMESIVAPSKWLETLQS